MSRNKSMRFVIAILFFLTYAQSRAENWQWLSLYNQLSHGRFCGEQSAADFAKSGFKCNLKNNSQNSPKTSWELFEESVFNEAAPLQITKNQCLSDQLDALASDPKLFETWSQTLAAAWLRKRKADLILNTCTKENREVVIYLDPAEVSQSKKQAYQKAIKQFPQRKSLSDDWQDVCFDKDKLQQLQHAKPLFQVMVPVVSDDAFFKAMSNNRNMLLLNGKPITDEDILKMNMEDFKNVNLDFDPVLFAKFNKNIKNRITELSDGRKDMSKNLEKTKSKDGSYNLDLDKRRGIFDDDTIYQLLCQKDKKFCDNFVGLDKTKSEFMTTGEFCIFAKYERSAKKEIMLFAGETFLLGAFAGLRKASTIKEAAVDGFSLATMLLVKQQLTQACLSTGDASQKTTSRERIRLSAAQNSEALRTASVTKEVGFNMFDLEIKSPACEKLDPRNINFLAAKAPMGKAKDCGLNLLMLAPQLKIALPATGMMLGH